MPISLVIAITGHRDLRSEDFPSFEQKIAEIFEKLKMQYRHTPLLLLSGLAEGADRIAARAASRSGVPYIGVLPMPLRIYRQDFTSESSDAEFVALQANAKRCIEIPLPAGVTPEDLSSGGEIRDRQYESLGRFLVQSSQILIAIWDQDRVIKTGGTSHVVAMKLREEPASGRLGFSRMNTEGAGPVYVLPAKRIGSKPGVTPALKCEIRYPEGALGTEYAASYQLLDRFNANVASAGRYFANAVKRSRAFLFEGEEAIGLTAPMEWVATIYSQADALAIHFATSSLILWRVVFVLLAISGVALTGANDAGEGKLLFCYYLCLGLSIALILWERKSERRGRHEDYRALAEALRVQFFWMAAGLPDRTTEQYLRKQAGEMVWIRDALSECELYDDVLNHTPPSQEELPLRLRLAHTWVASQASYFLRTKNRHESAKQNFSFFASSAAAVGFLAPVAGIFLSIGGVSRTVAAIALWWAALAWSYIERRGFKQEARQYARMFRLFQDADADLKKFELENNLEASEETIRELGREALRENGDWLSMHRERKLSVEVATG